MGFYQKMNELENYLELSLEEQIKASLSFQDDEVGLFHPETGAVVRLQDSGSIHMTAGHKGNKHTHKKDPIMFRLNADTSASSLFAKKSHFFNNVTHFHTGDDGFRINEYQLNPEAFGTEFLSANQEAVTFLKTLLSTGYVSAAAVPVPPVATGDISSTPVFKRYQNESEKALSSLLEFTREMRGIV